MNRAVRSTSVRTARGTSVRTIAPSRAPSKTPRPEPRASPLGTGCATSDRGSGCAQPGRDPLRPTIGWRKHVASGVRSVTFIRLIDRRFPEGYVGAFSDHHGAVTNRQPRVHTPRHWVHSSERNRTPPVVDPEHRPSHNTDNNREPRKRGAWWKHEYNDNEPTTCLGTDEPTTHFDDDARAAHDDDRTHCSWQTNGPAPA